MSNTEQQVEREMLESVNDLTEALFRRGHLDEKDLAEAQQRRSQAGAKPLRITLGEFDPSKIVVRQFTPDEIREVRQKFGASQAVLALHLGVTTNTLSQWERGRRQPDGPAQRLLSLIERHGLAYVE